MGLKRNHPKGQSPTKASDRAPSSNAARSRPIQIALACLSALGLAIAGCNTTGSKKVPIFLLVQVAPDGSKLGAAIPSALVASYGSPAKVMAALPPHAQFDIVKFGKVLRRFETRSLSSADDIGPIALFEPKMAFAPTDPLWRDTNLLIVPSPTSSPSPSNPPTLQFACPNKVGRLTLDRARSLFQHFGVDAAQLRRVTLASVACIDVNGDRQPEIVAGLRLDNPNRPVGTNFRTWEAFLARPPVERREYSLLALLHQEESGTWQAKRLLAHRRDLSFIGDSISSHQLYGAQDLDGDGWTELVVLERGLDSIADVRVLRVAANWQFSEYYRGDRTLEIVQ